jgi:pimeloyl-ACP methyl ester carboxylesterase
MSPSETPVRRSRRYRSRSARPGEHDEPRLRPLLIIDGEKDYTVPWAIANAAYKWQRRNRAVTEIVKMPNRGHSLTIDHGWREVAQTALDFVKRFA